MVKQWWVSVETGSYITCVLSAVPQPTTDAMMHAADPTREGLLIAVNAASLLNGALAWTSRMASCIWLDGLAYTLEGVGEPPSTSWQLLLGSMNDPQAAPGLCSAL